MSVLNHSASAFDPAIIVNHISKRPSAFNYLILPPGSYIAVAITVAGSYTVALLYDALLFHPPATTNAVVLQSVAISVPPTVYRLLHTAVPGIGICMADIKSDPTKRKW